MNCDLNAFALSLAGTELNFDIKHKWNQKVQLDGQIRKVESAPFTERKRFFGSMRLLVIEDVPDEHGISFRRTPVLTINSGTSTEIKFDVSSPALIELKE